MTMSRSSHDQKTPMATQDHERGQHGHNEQHVYLHFVADSQRLEGKLDHLMEMLVHMEHRIMASLQDVKDALIQAATDATAEKAEVAAALGALTDQIVVLQGQISGGAGVSSADLDDLKSMVEGVDEQVKNITVPVLPA